MKQQIKVLYKVTSALSGVQRFTVILCPPADPLVVQDKWIILKLVILFVKPQSESLICYIIF